MVAREVPSPWILVLLMLIVGWTGIPRMLLGEREVGFLVTIVGGVVALGAIALRVGEHPAAPFLVGALLVLWIVNALTIHRAYVRALAHARRSAIVQITRNQIP